MDNDDLCVSRGLSDKIEMQMKPINYTLDLAQWVNTSTDLRICRKGDVRVAKNVIYGCPLEWYSPVCYNTNQFQVHDRLPSVPTLVANEADT